MPTSELQNRFGGVNQRALRFEALDFFRFDGCWPQWAGIQSRMNGKAFLELSVSSNPVYAIFQTFTPQGYTVGYYQTFANVSTDTWADPSWEINTTALNLVDINPNGDVIGPLDTPYGFDAGSGLGGGTGNFGKWRVTHTDYTISSILTNLLYFTDSTSIPDNVIPIPNADPLPTLTYLDFQNATAITQQTAPSNALVASLDSATTNSVDNNLAPPPNNNQVQTWSSTAINTTGTIDLTALIQQNTINATLLATVNGTSTEIPFQANYKDLILNINTQQYLVPASIIQVAENFDSSGNPVSVPPDTGYGDYGMKERNQSQNTTISLDSVRIYNNSFTYGSG